RVAPPPARTAGRAATRGSRRTRTQLSRRSPSEDLCHVHLKWTNNVAGQRHVRPLEERSQGRCPSEMDDIVRWTAVAMPLHKVFIINNLTIRQTPAVSRAPSLHERV